jgi:hypothetical protein
MKMDRKYKGRVYKNDGSLVPDDEWIVFRAKDRCVPEMLIGYIGYCYEQRVDIEHITGMMELLSRVMRFQLDNPERCKFPDTLPGELEEENA